MKIIKDKDKNSMEDVVKEGLEVEKQLNESNLTNDEKIILHLIELAENNLMMQLALKNALISKGIITEEDLNKGLKQAYKEKDESTKFMKDLMRGA